MTNVLIFSYARNSASAKKLSEALGVTLVKRGENPPANSGIPVSNWINWGHTGKLYGLNKHAARACSKLTTLTMLDANNVRTPNWTTKKDLAKSAILDQGGTVVCRTDIWGHSGRGIVIAQNQVDLVNAPLYTEYINKDAEYRVHVFDGEVIDQRRKVPASDGRAITSTHVCTHSNGYVFNFGVAPQDAKVQAINAVNALGLDFGAVDVITKDGVAYVLEVNTAPGLEGTTVDRYADAIRRKFP